MSQDFAKRRQHSAAKKPVRRKTQAQAQRYTAEESQPRIKGFRQYMSGLITGLFLSFLLYVGTLPKSIVPGDELAADQQPEAEVEIPKPRFDFYTVLPEQTMDIERDVDVVEPAADVSKPPTPATAPQPYYLQAGSFRQQEDAQRRRAELLLLGLSPVVEESNGDTGRWFRVSLGPFDSHEAVSRARGLLASQNIDSVLLKRGP